MKWLGNRVVLQSCQWGLLQKVICMIISPIGCKFNYHLWKKGKDVFAVILYFFNCHGNEWSNKISLTHKQQYWLQNMSWSKSYLGLQRILSPGSNYVTKTCNVIFRSCQYTHVWYLSKYQCFIILKANKCSSHKNYIIIFRPPRKCFE